MNSENIEDYLRQVGEWQRENLLSIVTDPTTHYQARRYAWHLLDMAAEFLNGFFYCIYVSEGEETAEHYRKFFEQARSKKGFGNNDYEDEGEDD